MTHSEHRLYFLCVLYASALGRTLGVFEFPTNMVAKGVPDMKHISILVILAVAMMITACEKPAPVVEEVADSLAVVVDSALVQVDSTMVQIDVAVAVQVDSALVQADSLVEAVVDSAAAVVEETVAPVAAETPANR